MPALPTTDTDICNRALGSIGTKSTIGSMEEDSNEAVQCRLYYDTTRTSLLRAAHWNFARETGYLTLLKAMPGTPENPGPGSERWTPDYPAPPWLYSYLYPEGCQAVRYIQQALYSQGVAGTPIFSTPLPGVLPQVQGPGQRFIVATDKNKQNNRTNVVLCNQPQAIAVWTADIEIPDLWDSLFQDAMTDALASRLCIALTGKLGLAQERAKAALQSLDVARVRDGDEGLTVNDHIPEWIRIRGYAGDWAPAGGWYVAMWDTPSFLLI